jgi:hypothetical protein
MTLEITEIIEIISVQKTGLPAQKIPQTFQPGECRGKSADENQLINENRYPI